ncbi:hypothetical protein LXL04_030914 [Taraxacum kok-saghyz]
MFEKVDDICQVYETVVMMVLNPDEFIKLNNKNDDNNNTDNNTPPTIGRFRRLSLVFGNKDKSNNAKTPPNPNIEEKEKEKEKENPLRQSITSIFSKKPRKASPVTSLQNDWLDV